VHYRSRTLIVTNLEYDHADIFDDMSAIRRQFHHLVRTVPGNGKIIAWADSAQIDRVLASGCWTPVERYAVAGADWTVKGGAGQLTIAHGDARASGAFQWPGTHNRLNALAACAAAHAIGVPLALSLDALGKWQGVRRRLEKLGVRRGVTVYDDFAHHPTEIAATLEALRSSIGNARLVAVFEPRSNSMKAGVHSTNLAASFAHADSAYVFRSPDVQWDLDAALEHAPIDIATAASLDDLLARLVAEAEEGDHVVVMSNGSFGGLPHRLLDEL
ncbi:MAG: UDP-N-acetylmuramate:L-alanyl-gamma-D-glutamyl-meso-diaminopimelate ligase, partial [Gammaproteobacteria bacterium]|nr:UDP-N-acetylmuramate:L-alanyl-gamma-D-glutamyl-meso-diaminopimelate ligase [Gammaproteobacteria bacterium]